MIKYYFRWEDYCPVVCVWGLDILVGILLLWVFGERVSDKIVEVSEATGLPKVVIAVFIVSLSTTVPEITTSALAAYRGAGGIAVGDAVGSIITNVFLILGLAAALEPLRVEGVEEAVRTGVAALFAVVLLYALSGDGFLSRVDAVVLLGSYVAYSLYVVRDYRGAGAGRGSASVKDFVLLLVYGLFMVLGARLVVDGGVALAEMFGVSQAVIGLTLVAIGTSLPELTNTVISALKRRGDVGVGNIFGANLMNALVVTGVSGAVRPVHAGIGPLSFALAALGMAVSTWAVKRFRAIPRWLGGVYLLVYVAYVVALFVA